MASVREVGTGRAYNGHICAGMWELSKHLNAD